MKPVYVFLIGPDIEGRSILAQALAGSHADLITVIDLDNPAMSDRRHVIALTAGRRYQTPVVLISGFNRDSDEVQWSKDCGLLDASSLTLVFNPGQIKGWDRHYETRIKARKACIERAKFNTIFRDDESRMDQAIKATRRLGGHVKQLTADRDIVHFVRPEALDHIEKAVPAGPLKPGQHDSGHVQLPAAASA